MRIDLGDVTLWSDVSGPSTLPVGGNDDSDLSRSWHVYGRKSLAGRPSTPLRLPSWGVQVATGLLAAETFPRRVPRSCALPAPSVLYGGEVGESSAFLCGAGFHQWAEVLGELADLLGGKCALHSFTDGGISGLPEVRRNCSQGTGRFPFLTVTCSSRLISGNPACSAWRTRSRSSKSPMGSSPGGWMESYRAAIFAAGPATGRTS